MDDLSNPEVMDDTGEAAETEDRIYDTLEEAAEAIADDDEAEEVEEQSETDEAQPEEEDEAEGEEAPDDDLVFELPDGTTLTAAEIADLRGGGLRQADYTRKTEQLAADRKAHEAREAEFGEQQAFLDNALQNLTQFVQGIIGPEPSLELARTNPAQYTQQLAIRNQAMKEVQQLFQLGEKVNAQKSTLTEREQSRLWESENAKLAEAMPNLKDPARLEAFNANLVKVGQEFGFTKSEVEQTADSRLRLALHYAALGKKAEANRRTVQGKRVETPRPGKAKPAAAVGRTDQQRAVRRFREQGTIEAAAALDINFGA